MSELKVGDRVQITGTHRHNPGCKGVVVLMEPRAGNRFTIELDYDPGNVWHDITGNPCLRLGQTDLVLLDKED